MRIPLHVYGNRCGVLWSAQVVNRGAHSGGEDARGITTEVPPDFWYFIDRDSNLIADWLRSEA